MKSSAVRLLSLIACLVLLGATVFVYVALLSPSYAGINELRGDLVAKRHVLADQRQIVDHLTNLASQYEGVVDAYKASIAQAIPSEESYPSLVGQIDFLARSSGLFLESMNLSPLPFEGRTPEESANPVVGKVQLNLRMTGPYPAFKTFLHSLETNIRIMDVLTLNTQVGSSGNQNLSYTLVVNTYYQSF